MNLYIVHSGIEGHAVLVFAPSPEEAERIAIVEHFGAIYSGEDLDVSAFGADWYGSRNTPSIVETQQEPGVWEPDAETLAGYGFEVEGYRRCEDCDVVWPIAELDEKTWTCPECQEAL